MALGNLFFHLRQLGENRAFALRSTLVRRGNLLFLGGELAGQYVQLVLPKVGLLLRACFRGDQLLRPREFLPCILDLAAQVGRLPAYVEHAACRTARRGFQLAAAQAEQRGVYAAHLCPALQVLAFFCVEGGEQAGGAGRYYGFCGFKYARGIVRVLIARTGGQECGAQNYR